jgi:hypothetical protein
MSSDEWNAPEEHRRSEMYASVGYVDVEAVVAQPLEPAALPSDELAMWRSMRAEISGKSSPASNETEPPPAADPARGKEQREREGPQSADQHRGRSDLSM